MSIEAMMWAMNLAPVPYDTTKPNAACAAVLVGLANHADPDGRAAFPATDTLVRYTRLSRRTVVTALDRLAEEGIITPCDPDVIAAKIKRADRRPNGWDLSVGRYRDDLTAEELGAIARSNPMLRGAVAEMLHEVQQLHPAFGEPGAVSDERGAMGAERGATTAEPGAAVAPEPTKNYSSEPTSEPDTIGAADAARTSKRAHRLPEGWAPDEPLRQWFREQPFANVINPVTETDKFIDWARAANDRVGVKKDWPAAWRNWMRSAAERRTGGTRAPHHPPVDSTHRERVDSHF